MIGNRYRIALVVAVFLAVIAFPMINRQLHLVKDIESTENRQMAARPEMQLSHLDPYPGEYEKYYNDSFTIRSLMVRSFNLVNLELFRKSPLPDKVAIGRDGWLFMADAEMESYQGLNRFTLAELDSIRIELEYRKQYLEARGIRFYFMVAPTKAAIYPEYMPSTVYRVDPQTWGEQLVEYLDNNSNIRPIDAYRVLRSKKVDQPLYYRLDNHWNQLGAYYCAEEFFRRLKNDIPDTDIPSLDHFKLKSNPVNSGNILKMISNIGNYEDISFELTPAGGFKAKDAKPKGYPVIKGFPYPWEYEMDREIPGSSLPRILVITDSFGGNIFPFIAEGFSRTVKIFDAWQFKLNEEIVESEKPDVVLVIGLESNLRSLLKYRSALQ